jgi:endo-1,4-beta-xylanase
VRPALFSFIRGKLPGHVDIDWFHGEAIGKKLMTADRFARRKMLAGIAASAFLPLAGRVEGKAGPSLDALARLSGRRFGSAMGSGMSGPRTRSFQDRRYRALMAAECGVITPENELKWSVVRKGSAGPFDFGPSDQLLAFSEANAMALRGHTLLWHHPDYTPSWLSEYDYGAQPASAAAKLIEDHVSTVCKHYGQRILSYDGVNEAIDPETGEMRQTPLTRALAPQDAVDLVFHAARAAAPQAELVYNDYMSWEPGRPRHLPAVLSLLEGFRKRGVPVDALGIQSHIGDPAGAKDAPFGARDERGWRRFLDAVTAMGYRLHVTELDVSDKKLPAPIAVRDRAVATYARDWLDCLLDYSGLGDVIVWGMSDQYSWLNGLTPRADGLLKRPSCYDEAFNAKPLRQAIADAFLAAARRRSAQ